MTAEFSVAVHALVYLRHVGGLVSSQALAENICTNPARVRKILAPLHRAGLVEARQGQGSGYLPVERDITLREIAEALGESAVSVNWRSGDVDRECLVSSGMGDVMDGIYAELNELCAKKLETITISSIVEHIFSKQEE